MNIAFIQQNIWLFSMLILWEMFWKAMALWRAAKNNDLGWYLAIVIINTVGILPILYIIFAKKRYK